MNILNLADRPCWIRQLAEWHHQEWQGLNPGQTLKHRIDAMQAYLDNALIPSTYIALENNTLLGSAAIVEHDMDNKPELSPWLASVYVDKEYRYQGIGSKLVKHVINIARKANVTELFLFTTQQAEFYSKLGWNKLQSEKYRDEDVTIMSIKPGSDQ